MSTWRYTSRISPVATFSQDAAPSPQTPPLQGALSYVWAASQAACAGYPQGPYKRVSSSLLRETLRH